MYLRNVKQLLRAANFDERSYGFGGLMDLLRACQRDGFMRVERDRRRGLRIFPGSALGPVGVSRSQAQQPEAQLSESLGAESAGFSESAEPSDDVDNIGNLIDTDEMADATDSADSVPAMVVDTTAELLGRAKPKGPRARAAVPTTRRVAKKATSSRKTGRARKASVHSSGD
jgi:hypothetical protein